MSIWIAIHPNHLETRVLATAGSKETLLKARLNTRASHPRALPTLLEAVALWQGRTVRAALVADEHASTSGTNLFSDCFDVVGPTPLFQLAIVDGTEQRGHRDSIGGMGSFRDLKQVLLAEVAR